MPYEFRSRENLEQGNPETESRAGVGGEGLGVTANGPSFGGDENVLKLTVKMIAHICDDINNPTEQHASNG